MKPNVTQAGPVDEGEALRYRTAGIGGTRRIHLDSGVLPQGRNVALVCGSIFCPLFRHVGDNHPYPPAELGPPAHDLYNAGPDLLLTDALGTRRHRESESFGDVAFFSG